MGYLKENSLRDIITLGQSVKELRGHETLCQNLLARGASQRRSYAAHDAQGNERCFNLGLAWPSNLAPKRQPPLHTKCSCEDHRGWQPENSLKPFFP